MKKIGFLYGNEKKFSQDIIKHIENMQNPVIKVEELEIGILYNKSTSSEYDVILDRFSNFVPFYKSAIKYMAANKAIVINGNVDRSIYDDFIYLTMLSELKINVPKTAIFPNKTNSKEIVGSDLHNLEYPLKWDEMFKKIGFPANIKSNRSNELYDCFRIHNKNDFFFIYDMSGTNTLLLQEVIDNAKNNFRIFIVGDEKCIVNYELHKAKKDRYSVANYDIPSTIEKEINRITKVIKNTFNLDMYVLDIAITDKHVFVLNIEMFAGNVNNMFLPEQIYNWLVEQTAILLVDTATHSNLLQPISTKKAPALKRETTTKKIKK